MKQFKTIYEENKKLDLLFGEDLYNDDIYRKNIIELLVEIGELANETRCFKYWSKKAPSDKKIILEEYADCLIMVLVFCNMLDISLDEQFEEPIEKDINDQFLCVYKIASNLIDNFNKEYVKKMLVNFIYLGRLLNFDDNDIINSVLDKIEKNKKRLVENFVN